MVTRYRARCTSTTDGKQHYAREESRPPIIVRHLLEATAYTCKVAARNPSGWSVYSKPSNQVVTKTRRPGAPVITSVTPGARSLQVAFGPPANHGGTSITAYRVTCTSSDGGVMRQCIEDLTVMWADRQRSCDLSFEISVLQIEHCSFE